MKLSTAPLSNAAVRRRLQAIAEKKRLARRAAIKARQQQWMNRAGIPTPSERRKRK